MSRYDELKAEAQARLAAQQEEKEQAARKPKPDWWTDRMRPFIKRMPAWARLASLGGVAVLVLIVVLVGGSGGGSGGGSSDGSTTYGSIPAQAVAVQLLENDGYTNSKATVSNAGAPADVTGFALSWPDTADIVEAILVFDNTADAQSAYNALLNDSTSTGVSVSFGDSGQAVRLTGINTDVGRVLDSNW